MASKPKTGTLSRSKGWSLFAACWIVTFVAVWGLRQAFIPREELDCFSRVKTLQGAVDRWDQSHPKKVYKDTDDIDETPFLPQDGEDEVRMVLRDEGELGLGPLKEPFSGYPP